MNNVITTTGTFTVIASVALGILRSNLAQAHMAQYNDGYNTGYSNAINGIAIDTGYLHSQSDRWQAGYEDGWNAGKASIVSGNTQQSESSNVNVKGNNNRVTVIQGERPTSRCLLICVTVNH